MRSCSRWSRAPRGMREPGQSSARGIAAVIALRSALGATRQRLIAHLLKEACCWPRPVAVDSCSLFLGAKLLMATVPPSMGDYAVVTSSAVCAQFSRYGLSVLVGRAVGIVSMPTRTNCSSPALHGRTNEIIALRHSRSAEIVGARAPSAAAHPRKTLQENQIAYGFDPVNFHGAS